MRRSAVVGCPVLSVVLALSFCFCWPDETHSISFEEFSNGWRVSDDYAFQGVRFVSDYVNPSTRFRSAPTITIANSPHSAPNVLENASSDKEIFNSGGVPLVILFSKPVKSVSFRFGCVDCEVVPTATIKLFDCAGVERLSLTANSAMNFPTLVEANDPTETTRTVVIDYGTSIVREAIDDLSFVTSSKPDSCEGTSSPSVHITSHTDGQLVAGSEVILDGTASDKSGFLASFKINGGPVPLSPRSSASGLPTYAFSHPMSLAPGMNPITAWGINAAGKAGAHSITLNYGPPATFKLAEFHLTQRGIMQDLSGQTLGKCDIDSPLVAGKDAIIRVRLDVRTAEGAQTFVDQLEMRLYRVTGGEVLVDSFFGEFYGAVVAGFTSASELAGIHFWIPGSKLDPAGSANYRVEFQAYVQTHAVGPVLQPPCFFINSFRVTETNPVKMLTVPAEVPLFDPILGEKHLSDLNVMMAEVVRTYPVRQGVSMIWSSEKTGLKIAATNPVYFCDGVKTSTFCPKTGYEYTFKDTNPGGLLRADHAQVLMSGTDCVGEHTLGGRIVSNTTFPCPASPIGLFRGGDHPKGSSPSGGWMKYAVPLDDNHNGVIDAQDLENYVAEFLDTRTGPPTWSTNKADFGRILLNGETFRGFQDQNGNFCNDETDFHEVEPSAPTHRRWYNANAFVMPSARDALQRYNAVNSNKFDFGYMIFPKMFNPDNAPDFGFWGGGSASGNVAFVRAASDSTMAHELGHSLGGFEDLYLAKSGQTGLPITEADRRVPFWAAYAQGKQVKLPVIYDVMHATSPVPNEQFFQTAHYQALFDKLKVTEASSEATIAQTRRASIQVSGMVGYDGQLVSVTSQLTSSATDSLPDRNSRYQLVIGRGSNVLLASGIRMEPRHPFEGQNEAVVPPPSFTVTVEVPALAEWFEIRAGETVLWRRDISAKAPTVHLLQPNGGEVFPADTTVRIRWTAVDEDKGTSLTYTLLYISGGERPAIVLATGLTATEFNWRTGSVPGTSQALIRVIASDGVNEGEDTSDAVFEVGKKAPVIAISSPPAGAKFLQWQRIPLRAVALEPEGDAVTTTWFVDGESRASGNSAQLPPLGPGSHEARFLARDPDGQTASATVQFEVLADLDRDGMSDNYEEKWGLDPGNPADASADPDADGVINFDEAQKGTSPTSGDLIPLREFFFAQVGDGADAGLSLRTSLAFVNTGDSAAQATVEFFNSLGQPMELQLGPYLTSSYVSLYVDKGVSTFFETPGTGSLKAGYARVRVSEGLGASAVLSMAHQGTLMFEAGIPESTALTDFSLFIDSTGGKRNTGVALVNAGTSQANITFRLYDPKFNLVATRRISEILPGGFDPGMHLARYANEIFPEVAQRALSHSLLTVASDQPLGAVTLRQWDDPAKGYPADVPTMSTFPVIPGRADLEIRPATQGTFYFPQIADGTISQPGRTVIFTSTVVLVNTNGATSAKIEFFNSDGTPMAVSLGGAPAQSTYDIPLARGGFYSAETSGQGALRVGYAKVTASGDIGGTAVFTFRENGITMYETGVPSSQPTRQFTIFSDTARPARDTGLAIVNAGAGNAQVTFRLYSQYFVPLASRTLDSIIGGPLRPGEHFARFATEMFPEIRASGVENAVITVESSEPLAAVTLRQYDHPSLSFPAEVNLVTVFPVLVGRPTP